MGHNKKKQTTVAIYREDLDFLHKLREKGEWASVKVVIGKIIRLVKHHKLEGEIQ